MKNHTRFCLFNRLTTLWQKVFPSKFYDDLPLGECPILIGIMRLFEENNDGLITNEYQFKPLLTGDTLTRTQTKVPLEMLLNKLVNFKEEVDENEQALVSFCLFSRMQFEGRHSFSTDFVLVTGLYY